MLLQSKASGLTKIKKSQNVPNQETLGTQHLKKAHMKKVKFLSRPKEKVSRLCHLGSSRAQL